MDQHDNKILERVRRQERNLLRSISWISLCIALLYVCGYVWRSWYYARMGIPVSMIDFPFPEILIPKMHLFIFIVYALFVILYESYSNFFIKSKRLHRAKAMGIDAPINKLQDYAFQSNSGSPDKTNYQVIMEFLANYIATNSKDNPQWQFKRDEFDKKALELCQDIPIELKSSFISYSTKFYCMDETEQNQTIKDVIGWPAEGSKIYEKIQMAIGCLFLLLVIIVVIFIRSQDIIDIILSLIYMVMGVLVGCFLVKVSKVEARWQMWHSVLISVMVMLVLNGIDGYVTAGIELKNGNLPIVKIIKTDGDEQKGLLLGSFTDGYIIAFSDPNDCYRHTKIHKQAVESISWITLNLLNTEREKTNKELENLNNKIEALNKETVQEVTEKENLERINNNED